MTEDDQQRRRVGRDVAVIVGVFLLAGVVVGLVWPHLFDPAVAVRTPEGISTDEVQLGKEFASDGWFIVLGMGVGLVLGLLLMLTRHTHEVVSLLAIVAAAAAAAYVAAQLGAAVGPADPASILEKADVGASAPTQVRLESSVGYLIWPLFAALGALLVLWRGPVRHRDAATVVHSPSA